jgi:uncharacterized membrane protein
MKMFLSAYAGAMAAMLALDAVWLSTMAERLYQPQLGDLLTKNFRAAPAVAFYLVYNKGAEKRIDRAHRREIEPADIGIAL